MTKKTLHIIIILAVISWLSTLFIFSWKTRGDDGIRELNDNITQAETTLVEKKNIYDVEHREYIEALSWLDIARNSLASLYDKKKQMLSGFISGATTP